MSNLDPGMESTRVMAPAGGQTADRTLVAPGGSGLTQMGAGHDLYRTQVGAVSTCPVCKSTTPLPEIYCGDCGYLLSATPGESIEMPVEETSPAELVDLTNGRRYRLRSGINTLGRQGTDVLINEGTISRNHARIVVENGAVTIEDLGSSNGTKVGDKRIGPNQPTPATHGMRLKFGNWQATLELAGAPAGAADPTIAVSAADRTLVEGSTPAEAPPAPTGPIVALLKQTEGPGKDIPLAEGTITVGRRPNNTIILPQDAYISGRHAEIVTDNTGTYLIDLGSTNGTVVNGEKLVPDERQLLLDGDMVELGQTKYLFTFVESEEDKEEGQETKTEAEAKENADESAAPETGDTGENVEKAENV